MLELTGGGKAQPGEIEEEGEKGGGAGASEEERGQGKTAEEEKVREWVS